MIMDREDTPQRTMTSILNEQACITFMTERPMNTYTPFERAYVMQGVTGDKMEVDVAEQMHLIKEIYLYSESGGLNIRDLEWIHLYLERPDIEHTSTSTSINLPGNTVEVGRYSGEFLLQSQVLNSRTIEPLVGPICTDKNLAIYCEPDKMVSIPFLGSILYPATYQNLGYTLHVEFQWKTLPPDDLILCVDGFKSKSEAEQERMRTRTSEILQRSVTTINIATDADGKIDAPLTNRDMEVGLLFVHLPEGARLKSGHLQLGDKRLEINDLTGKSIHRRPMLKGTYMLDFGHNISLYHQIQPAGNQLFTPDTRLNLVTDKPAEISVTLVYFDIIAYIAPRDGGMYGMIFSLARASDRDQRGLVCNLIPDEERARLAELPEQQDEQQEPQEPDEEQEAADTQDTTEGTRTYTEVVRADSDIEYLPLSELPEPRPMRRYDFDRTVVPLYYDLIKEYQKSRARVKITEENCVIKMSPIPYGGYYYECPTCHKVTSMDGLDTWITTVSSTCPHCRLEFETIPTLYRQPRSPGMILLSKK